MVTPPKRPLRVGSEVSRIGFLLFERKFTLVAKYENLQTQQAAPELADKQRACPIDSRYDPLLVCSQTSNMQTKAKIPQSIGDVKPNPNVISRRLGDEIVLFHLETDRFYELNGSAARFWELLSTEASPNQVCEQMLEEFAVDPRQLAGETKTLIDSLHREDLITIDE